MDDSAFGVEHEVPDMPGMPAAGKIDITVPHSARIWNYWLGGKDYYPIDQYVGGQLSEIFPAFGSLARQSRYFLARAVRYLAEEQGIRQFLDIGAGLPAVDNTHEIAQRAAPASRVVYVDNDPLVVAYARALLTSGPEGICGYVDADLHDPADILAGAAKTLDFTRPVAVLLLAVLGHVGDDKQAHSIVKRLMDTAAGGSYLVVAHGSSTCELLSEACRRYNASGADPYFLRSPEQIARFFAGLELAEPGVVPLPRWRPGPDPSGLPTEAYSYGGIGRKSLNGAKLRYANLARAVLEGVWLEGSDLTASDPRRAFLVGTRFRGANLSRAYLQGANLRRADLSNAGLHGANLADAILDDALLRGARADEATTWPTGFDAERRQELGINETRSNVTAQA